jgi:hypothetical protein
MKIYFIIKITELKTVKFKMLRRKYTGGIKWLKNILFIYADSKKKQIKNNFAFAVISNCLQ